MPNHEEISRNSNSATEVVSNSSSSPQILANTAPHQWFYSFKFAPDQDVDVSMEGKPIYHALCIIGAETQNYFNVPEGPDILDLTAPLLKPVDELEPGDSAVAETTSYLNTFTCFPVLPYEIRLNIYHHTTGFTRPQFVHAIAPSCATTYPLSVLWGHHRSMNQYPNYAPPAALSIDRNARQEALKDFTHWKAAEVRCHGEDIMDLEDNMYISHICCDFECCNYTYSECEALPKRLYVNPKVDMFLFGMFEISLDAYLFLEDPLFGDRFLFNQTPEAVLAQYNSTFGVIRHIGIFFATLFSATNVHRHAFATYLRHFSQLETLTLFLGTCGSFLRNKIPSHPKIPHERRIEKATQVSGLDEAFGLARRFMERLLDDAIKSYPEIRRPKLEVLIYRDYFEDFFPGDVLPTVHVPPNMRTEASGEPCLLDMLIKNHDMWILNSLKAPLNEMRAAEEELRITSSAS